MIWFWDQMSIPTNEFLILFCRWGYVGTSPGAVITFCGLGLRGFRRGSSSASSAKSIRKSRGAPGHAWGCWTNKIFEAWPIWEVGGIYRDRFLNFDTKWGRCFPKLFSKWSDMCGPPGLELLTFPKSWGYPSHPLEHSSIEYDWVLKPMVTWGTLW